MLKKHSNTNPDPFSASTFYVEGVGPGGSAVTVTAHYGSYDYPGHILWEIPAITDVVNITVLTGPGGFYATLGDAKNVVRLNWTAPHMGETGFRLQWWKPTQSTWEDLATLGEAETWSHTLPADYPGKTYEYRIFSVAFIGAVFATSGPTTTTGSGIALQKIEFGGSGAQTVLRDKDGSAYTGAQWYDGNMNGTVTGETLYDWDGNVAQLFTNRTKEGFAFWAGPVMEDWENKWPLSYVRSTTGNESRISASPTFFYAGTAGANWKIQGSADHYHFLAQSVLGGGNWVWSSLDSCEALPTTIDDTTLTVTWQLSIDGGDTWIGLGFSENHLYVTGVAAPSALETVLDIGCKAAKDEAPDDASGRAGVRDKIWGKFSSLIVERVADGQPLLYTPNTAENTASLLSSRQGQCNAWTRFLSDVLGAQGVTSTRKGIESGNKTIYPRFRCYTHAVQGSSTPWVNGPPGFQYHEVLFIDGDDAVYDPSYGTRTSPDQGKGWTAFRAWEETRVAWLFDNTINDWTDNTDVVADLVLINPK